MLEHGVDWGVLHNLSQVHDRYVLADLSDRAKIVRYVQEGDARLGLKLLQ